jgi:hypothetical protein
LCQAKYEDRILKCGISSILEKYLQLTREWLIFIRNVLSWFSMNQWIYVDIVLSIVSVELEFFRLYPIATTEGIKQILYKLSVRLYHHRRAYFRARYVLCTSLVAVRNYTVSVI